MEAGSFGYLGRVSEELEDAVCEIGTATVPDDSAKAELSQQRRERRESGCSSSLLRMISCGHLPKREPEAGRHRVRVSTWPADFRTDNAIGISEETRRTVFVLGQIGIFQ